MICRASPCVLSHDEIHYKVQKTLGEQPVLRRADNVRLVLERPRLFQSATAVAAWVGSKAYYLPGKMTPEQWQVAQERQFHRPNFVIAVAGRNLWQFRGKFYWDSDGLTENEIHAMLIVRGQRQRQRVERAQAIVAMGEMPRQAARGAIPDDLRQLIWQRDGGRCCQCGSRHELQFDHIIPLSMGGATTAENLQILCGPCNRRKGAGLTVR